MALRLDLVVSMLMKKATACTTEIQRMKTTPVMQKPLR